MTIGVHAGKYPTERRTDRIAMACDRLGVSHPVVNDRHFRIWRAFDVRAWPTTVLVGPDGRYLGTQSGEFAVEEMAAAISRILEAEETVGGPFVPPAPASAPALRSPQGAFRYPGRVLVDGERLFVSDTGNARVVELALDARSLASRDTVVRARIVREWGGVPGTADGGPEEARFAEPQGMALGAGSLFVADRGTHTVRRVDLASGQVETLAGTGEIGRWSVRSGAAQRSALRSPWALAWRDGAVFVAMAGSHQIWAIEVRQRTISLHAGSGGEDISDGRHDRAALAQPMGLALGSDGLYFADAESSAVRAAGLLPTGAIRTLVGTGLFDHGDRDGVGAEALLQHPQDLTWWGGRLLVADTYNDKVKSVDPATRDCRALQGDAGSGDALLEPAGISSDGRRVFVADTGAHAVRLLDPEDGSLREVVVE